MPRNLCAALASMVALWAPACGSGDSGVGSRSMALEAYCTAYVTGTGDVDVETDYLPSVVSCENGGASFEALKVQAVAARSYLYYKLDLYGEVGDGTGDQVYSCGREPGAEHLLAVEETSGEVLRYQGSQVAAFYVAGALQEPPDCTGGTSDPTGTESYVTYNLGLSGDSIEQTSLGWIDPSNKANRGCMSQNGSDCLSSAGWVYDDILRFYYGEDIEILRAEGACIEPEPPPPDAGSDPGPDAGPVQPDAGGAGGEDAQDPGSAGGLIGGCSAAASGRADVIVFALLALLLLAFPRRSTSGVRAGPAA